MLIVRNHTTKKSNFKVKNITTWVEGCRYLDCRHLDYNFDQSVKAK